MGARERDPALIAGAFARNAGLAEREVLEQRVR
jgi:hypothetical protein